jgi:hypothetical protein
MSIYLRSLVDYVSPKVLDTNEKAVLGALADHGNDEGESIYPSMPRLMWKTSLTERGVQQILLRLYEKKLVKKVVEGGGRITNHWEIDVDNLAAISADPRSMPWKTEPSLPKVTPAPDAGVPPQEVPPTPAPSAGDPSLKRSLNHHSASSGEVTSLTLDFNEANTQGKNKKAQKEIKVRCYLCGTATIGIMDRVSPCCNLPIAWLNHPVMDRQIAKEKADAKAAAKRDDKLQYLLPGTRYLVEQARAREDTALGQKPGTSQVLASGDELNQFAIYEQKYGEQFMHDLLNNLNGKFGRALLAHAKNYLPFAVANLNKDGALHGSTQSSRPDSNFN